MKVDSFKDGFFQYSDDSFPILNCPKCNCPLVEFESVGKSSNGTIPAAIRFKTYCEHKFFYLIFSPENGEVRFYAATDHSIGLDYHEYINSEEWKSKAREAKDRAENRCQLCNRHADEIILDAHHRTYERLGNELPEDITVLCRECHELYEKNKIKKNGKVIHVG